MLTSRHNPRIQAVRRLLRRAAERRKTGLTVLEGVRLAEEAHRAGVVPQSVFYTRALRARGQKLVEAWRAAGVPTWEVAPELLTWLSETETPQGLLVLIPRASPRREPHRPDFVLVLDAIQDPGNMGTLLRTAWAAGVQAVWVAPGSVDPWAPKVLRAGMGAHFAVPIREADWATIRQATRGLARFLAAAHEGRPYFELPGQRPLALAVSNEAHGASAAARAWATDAVHIPMPGGAESLNVAVASGILMFEVVRQRLQATRAADRAA
ncbi:MAG: RNA methyltransferase [Chloroflexi bacterium]|nr:RNA methyltransferase [Chloroflexota bacterium]